MDNAIQPADRPSASLARVVEQLAANPGVDMDKLQRVLELQERWRDNEVAAEIREDERRFNAAMVEFHRRPPKIWKDRHVEFRTDKGVTAYDHATLGNATELIASSLAQVGISHEWIPAQTESKITVTCRLTLGLYHRDTTLSSGPDKSGGKNDIQAIVSAQSYLQRHTLLAATGMATHDQDDDGKAAAAPDVSALAKAETLDSLADIYREMYKAAEAAKDKAALKAIIEAKDKRYAELAEIAQRQYAEAAQEIATIEQFNERILPLMKERGGEFKLWWAGEAKRRGWKANKATGLYEEAK